MVPTTQTAGFSHGAVFSTDKIQVPMGAPDVRHCRKGCMLTMLIIRGQSRQQRRIARKGRHSARRRSIDPR